MRPTAFALLLLATPGFALEPKEIVVVVNKAVPASREVADHYLAARKVPKGNVVELDLPTGEDISRADYDAKLAGPLREALKDRKAVVKVLLTVYGVPLRVGPKVLTEEDKKKLAELDKAITKYQEVLDRVLKLSERSAQSTAEADHLKATIAKLKEQRAALSGDQSTASVDSELMLLFWPTDHPLHRWVVNPLNWQASERARRAAPPTLMTCRLDGPTPAIAKRLVDDAVTVEATGLKGKAYFDARGIKFDPKKEKETGTGYGGYDESFREAAALLKAGGMDVTLDDKGELFAPESCKDAAIYAGWYSHAKFVDCCEFVPGAVAWHLASSEATTLRNDKSQVWCPNLLKRGVAATLGPVGEPYTVGFPKPAEFFGLLGTGKYTLVECYAKTVYFASWMGVLVGDPLYNPFAKNPVVMEEDVTPSPKGAPPVFR